MKTPNSVVELLKTLVRIPSVNPHGEPGTDGIGEKCVAEWLAGFLAEMGAEVELREVLPDRPNVVARWPGAKPGKPRVLFAPHTDTVSVQGMTIDPFGGELRDGRVWGRGASDTKGPMASMPLAREERFDFVIAAEPTNLDVVYTHKGSAFLGIQTRGKAGHASQPQHGENAIAKMLEVLNFIREDLTREAAAVHDPVLGSPTISIGTIHGGSKTNIIPDFCEASVDMRFVGELAALGAKTVGAPWFCDACFFAERGMPAIALGPGSILQAHTKDEWISVADLEKGAEFFTKFLARL
jgi:acetylornithine deacetylase/succinyl-diaminopimelate desuccinylase-like protein